MSDRLQGFCPACGSRSLFVGSGGHITCGVIGCPDPCVVDKLLDDSEVDHIVVFGSEGFDIKHPLRERANDELFDCELHEYCHDLGGPPRVPGRYRARKYDDEWEFYALPELVPPQVAERVKEMPPVDTGEE